MAYLDPIDRVGRCFRVVFTPPPALTVSQWADEFLYLSAEDSAEPGKFKTERAPYQRGMMDAVSDSAIKEVVYCTSSQIGKTLISKAILGYHIHQDPGPLLVMQPTVSVAETFSKDRLAPMVRDTPVLRDLIADPKSRTSGNTIDKKSFRGGHLTMIGATAPTELASRPIRIVFADEVDRYPASAGSEGDPLFLARQRSVTFHNRKFIMASTPTVAGESRIWQAFESSDQRYYWLPCPHCGDFHTLKWQQMIWTGSDPDTAMMACPHCGGMYGDAEKLRMLQQGEWRASSESRGIAGFHISALYSPWQTFSDVVSEWLAKKGHPQTLKTFLNLQLGECWEDRSGETIQADTLITRKEMWDNVPEDVALLTCGVDVQDNRLEASLLGWTASEQARVISHMMIWGDPGQPQVWEDLDKVLMATYETSDGRSLRIRSTCIDSGGHHTSRAYEFCRPRAGRKVVPVKGRSGNHNIWPTRATKTDLSKGVNLFLVGVDAAKDAIRSALAVKNPENPRYVAFSADLPDEYFQQLTSEYRHTTTNKSGRAVRVWKKPAGVRNEALDCFVYGLAALEMLKQGNLNLRIAARRAHVPEPVTEEAPKASMPPPQARPRPQQTRRSSSAIR